MKKYNFIIILFTGFISCNAQVGVIVPLGTLSMDVQNGTYIKDINGDFNPFVGTYVGHWDNKRFTLVLQKMEHVLNSEPNGTYFYEDLLLGKYEIINEIDNTILYSTMNIVENNDYPIRDLGNVNNGELKFGFFDIEERCRNIMKLRLYNMTTVSGITTVRYWGRGSSYGGVDIICPYPDQESIPKVLPYGFLTLTKVN